MNAEDSIKIFKSMLRIRMVEESISERYPQGKMRCPVHLSIGQELVSAVAGLFLNKNDYAVSGHRAHAHYLAKGGSLKAMLAEIYGKADGCSRGIGGSMHLIDQEVGFMGSTAIVGGTIPVGVGLALALQKNNEEKRLSAVFLGDGALEEGSFYESANFAAVKKLPVIFICENNLYSVYSPLKPRQPEGRKIFESVGSLGVKSFYADGYDIESSYKQLSEAFSHVRNRLGPAFIELSTYRWLEHCGPNDDDNLGYRPQGELNSWKNRDALEVFKGRLLNDKILDQTQLDIIEKDISAEIDSAFLFAEKSEKPSYNDLENLIFKEGSLVKHNDA